MKSELLFGAGLAAIALVCPSAAQAGDKVLYQPVEKWVAPVDFDKAVASHEPLVVFDEQVRMEGGVVSNYSDIAYKIENPEALTKLGSLQLSWLPDKGDLIVHRLEIYRHGQIIDLLAQGTRFDVLRREKELEKRSLDGSLTASLAVPGLKVGDVLRFSQTITKRDQALGDEMQFANVLIPKPAKVGFGRIRISWPKDAKMQWRTGPNFDAPPLVDADGYKIIDIPLPIPKREDQPKNAPARFTLPPLIQATSFTDWKDVSRAMAPHFRTEGTIAPGSALAKQVTLIEQHSSDPLARAADALQLVQDQTGYLMNGMNGGNYLPQSPEQTWDDRYGDCKAKSYLLLAMLRQMGIEAEAVLVRSKNGDAVSVMLPMPGDFDHMIVHAVIGGEDYWLDGTNAGTRLATIAEVPPFAYALPIRDGGADLVKMTERWPTAKDQTVKVTYDYRPGIDLPMLYDATIEVRGQMGAGVRPHVKETDPRGRIKYVQSYVKNLIGDGLVYDASLSYDDKSGIATIHAKGLLNSDFDFERSRGKLALNLPSTGSDFAPDRARAAWQDIPYAVGGPFGIAYDVTYLLPADKTKYELTGLGTVDEVVAGTRVHRQSKLSGDTLRVEDSTVTIPTEIPVSQLAQERAKASRLAGGDPVLRTGENPVRYWERSPEDARRRIAMLKPAYDEVIAQDPTEAWRWVMRGGLYTDGPDLKLALADYDKAIELEPSADNYSKRSSLRQQMGDVAGALADARKAYAVEGTPVYAEAVADILSWQGKSDEALAMLSDLDLSGDDRIKLLIARANILGEAGRKDEGWALLDEAETARPGDSSVLNAECWYMGNWDYRLKDAGATCDRAVKAADYASGVLDSRALVNYRLGKTDAALADLQAALISTPSQSTSLYLRGVIATEQGQKVSGERDIEAAKRLYGAIGPYFERFGIKPKA
ncbi:DUF3857 domain-containing protein [Qipengyuania algicida]|uniref:DUF3857 domain-containing protein n=1 Tax=Qipengyuania algicida TaxID=1836209 RepID=UPI00136B6118|nr:DUF3857 domain-containing protein [Qipengyuania algicida]